MLIIFNKPNNEKYFYTIYLYHLHFDYLDIHGVVPHVEQSLLFSLNID